MDGSMWNLMSWVKKKKKWIARNAWDRWLTLGSSIVLPLLLGLYGLTLSIGLPRPPKIIFVVSMVCTIQTVLRYQKKKKQKKFCSFPLARNLGFSVLEFYWQCLLLVYVRKRHSNRYLQAVSLPLIQYCMVYRATLKKKKIQPEQGSIGMRVHR